MAQYPWAFRTKAAVMSCDSTQASTTRKNLDLLHIWFWTNFGHCTLEISDSSRLLHAFSYSIPYDSWFKKGGPGAPFLKNEVETRREDKGPLNKVEREEHLGRSKWAHRESKKPPVFVTSAMARKAVFCLKSQNPHWTSLVWAEEEIISWIPLLLVFSSAVT